MLLCDLLLLLHLRLLLLLLLGLRLLLLLLLLLRLRLLLLLWRWRWRWLWLWLLVLWRWWWWWARLLRVHQIGLLSGKMLWLHVWHHAGVMKALGGRQRWATLRFGGLRGGRCRLIVGIIWLA